MAGEIKRLIDDIVQQRSKGNPVVAGIIKTKLTLKGINPDAFTEASKDDPIIIKKVLIIATEFGVAIR